MPSVTGKVQDRDNAGSMYGQQRAPLPSSPGHPSYPGLGMERCAVLQGAPRVGGPRDLSSRVASPAICVTLKQSTTLSGSRLPPLYKKNTLFPTLSPLVAGVGSPASQGLPEVRRLLTLQHRFLLLPRDGSDHRPRHLTLVAAAALAHKERGQALKGEGSSLPAPPPPLAGDSGEPGRSHRRPRLMAGHA